MLVEDLDGEHKRMKSEREHDLEGIVSKRAARARRRAGLKANEEERVRLHALRFGGSGQNGRFDRAANITVARFDGQRLDQIRAARSLARPQGLRRGLVVTGLASRDRIRWYDDDGGAKTR